MINTDHHFKYIDTKQELLQMYGASYNEMQLFTCIDSPSIEDFVAFCSAKRKSIINGFWHVITFFNNQENAVFTKLPITSMYEGDEVAARHIKAIYTFNTKNKYSKLKVYDSNSWTGMPTEVDII